MQGHLSVEIVVVSLDGLVLSYGDSSSPACRGRGYIVYTGQHYDALVGVVQRQDSQEEEEIRVQAEKRRREGQNSAKKAKVGPPWSAEETAALIKATKKYPAGSGRRWEQIAGLVSKCLHNERTADECIAKAKSISAKIKGGQKNTTTTTTTTAKTAAAEAGAEVQPGLAEAPAPGAAAERTVKCEKVT